MIRVEKYNFSHFDDLVNYQLPPDQAQYTLQPWQWFEGKTLLLESGMTAVSILSDNKAVGFFILDRSHHKLAYTENNQAVLLRSFSINPDYQGRGIALQSLRPQHLDPLIYNLSPQYNEIVLAVNPLNRAAYRLYCKAGFQAVGRIIIKRKRSNSVLSRRIR
ncbi:GNAT family N-acetyltransferase [Pasteurellaceae bacterium HPA106]|uniref:GNAT family N-acetyltransferase n=1 Tax=Spirabiliibacterium pneumoniae TaxID=221400 RepID=UPI001AADAA98|nr:GNAT family N-acetyltransferase [Spirabiliibacterium pneumoniae]MBE2896068.1 GNAT family N-acetyltransferase [Spirabiliibacterium pneumoniae]